MDRHIVSLHLTDLELDVLPTVLRHSADRSHGEAAALLGRLADQIGEASREREPVEVVFTPRDQGAA